VFGCAKLYLELNLIGNSKSMVERKWLPIQFMLFACAQNLLLKSNGVTNSNSRLVVTNHGKEFDVFFWVNAAGREEQIDSVPGSIQSSLGTAVGR
jgi:hypothetical protein